MPPPSNHPSLNLQIQRNPFFVARFQSGKDVPLSLIEDITKASGFLSFTKTDEEFSAVGELQDWMPDDLRKLSTWKCIRIMGPMEHNLTGILADFSAPLKAAQVPIFAVSTWNTDYVLVPAIMLDVAVTALKADGWSFV